MYTSFCGSHMGVTYEHMVYKVKEYVESLKFKYPYWNRTLGADHFFVTCHDIGVKATNGVPYLVKNSIRVVCSSSYDDEYIPHKDVTLPQVQLPFLHPAGGNDIKNRFLSPEAANLILGKKLDQELLERLKTALCAAKALLIDAERKQFHSSAVKDWLDSLKDAVYEADDLLDHVFTKAATQKEVSNFLPRFLNFKDREMVNEMEKIVRKIEDIEKHKYILGLEEIPMESMTWKTSTSLVKGNIYGRENDQEAIMKILNDNSEDKLSVIPIVGMGGVGKTTLAQWVYSNEDLMEEFDLKAWVCVSEEFDIVKITKTIIKAVTSRSCDMKDLNLLQLDLKDALKGKKFFIVLDDVWSDDRHSWDNLQKPFQYGAIGSKILVTTRIKDVASVVQTCLPYHLSELSDEYCWSVFADNACFPKSNGDSTLEEIGRKIVQKCKGLPLAAETLGRLLRRKLDSKDWNTILTSDIWEFSVKDSKIIPALLISYYHLPPHLKRCFIYCSLYPKDYEFYKDELILLWMAEDLLRPPKRGETLEEVGYECFDDLASRLFFKQCSTDDMSFVMHDLLHDLAIFVAGDFYFRLEELGKADEISIQTRHLSYGSLSHPISKNFDAIGRVKSLRTLLPIDFSTPSFSIESMTVSIPPKFKYLRVLSLGFFWQLDVLPDSIGELIHLRYLDLSCTTIKALPESLSNLYNLQTLKLINCDKLTMLPNGMQNLVNLRHLNISGTALEEMPRGMSKLKHLHLLSYFIVGEHEENGIKELGELSNLHGSFRIRKLENVTNSSEALKAKIMHKTHIEELYVEWSSGDDMVPNTQTERDIFDQLQPHKGLKVLGINGYKGTIFPIWVGQSSYHNMTRVSLKSCNNCCMLPSLGQLPSLNSLEIEDFKGLKNIGAEFYKNDDDHSSLATPFPSLEDLSFRKMSSWEVWCSSESNAFLRLKKLTISGCPRLTGDLPNHLPALETLEIDSCDELVYSLPRAPAIRELSISKSDKVGLEEIPLSLQSLSIGGWQLVESMFQAMTISQPTCLRSLNISTIWPHCSSTISFPGGCIPASMKQLTIMYCRKLEFPRQQQHELLESLYISNSCDSVTSFPLEIFPNLNSLELRNCENLESLSVSQSQVAALHRLEINYCPNFVSFPREGLNAPSMTRFQLVRCDKLKSLPCHMNTLLPKLEQLDISDCPEIESFPDGGLPPNLNYLRIVNCEKLLSSLSSIGKHECLSSLIIDGPCDNVKSFPKEGLLPQLPSLTTLFLYGFSSLETLECKQLLHLTSLEKLIISGCPKLENMTGERLPASLINLFISGSPLLEERCKMKHPQIWPKISHIHGITVTYRWVS